MDLRWEAIVNICEDERRSLAAAFQPSITGKIGLRVGVSRENAVYELVALSRCATGRGMMYVRALVVVTLGLNGLFVRDLKD